MKCSATRMQPIRTRGHLIDRVQNARSAKSGSMNACRNDGGIVSTPYGKYVIVLFNKNFSDSQSYNDHPATVFGSKVSRLIFDQYLALEGRLRL